MRHPLDEKLLDDLTPPPAHAVATFRAGRIDALVLGPFLVAA